MNSELYREMYKLEWEQKTHLVSSVNIPIFGVVTLSTVLATIALDFPYSNSPLTMAFTVAIVVSVVLILFALGFIFWSLLSVEYLKMPSPVKLREHYKVLLKWSLENGYTAADAQNDFSDAFDEHIAKAAEENGKRNKFRGSCIYFASLFLACALIPLAIAGAIYVSESIDKPDKIHKVQIIP